MELTSLAGRLVGQSCRNACIGVVSVFRQSPENPCILRLPRACRAGLLSVCRGCHRNIYGKGTGSFSDASACSWSHESTSRSEVSYCIVFDAPSRILYSRHVSSLCHNCTCSSEVQCRNCLWLRRQVRGSLPSGVSTSSALLFPSYT